jgi:4'-phosphopantetheinyl transferase
MKSRWIPYSGYTHLDATAVNLWRFRLDPDAVDDTLLSEDEKVRAQRLKVRAKAIAFAKGRSTLRHILSLPLGLSPEQVQFEYSSHGKPFLKGRPLFFNVSHSGEWGLCAVCWHHDLGVDLERLDPDLDMMLLARKYFSAQEQKVLHTAASHRRRRTFFRLWTGKEAILKAQGLGLSARLCSTTTGDDRCLVRHFPVAKGYLGALAINGDVERINRWDFLG